MKIITGIILLFGLSINIHAQDNIKLTEKRNSIKLDFFPFYYDFFDYRKQIRMGVEYEKKINSNFFATCNFDFGLFDDYTFIKYYDFFNQSQGMYSVEQIVTIKGFHLVPAYNRYIFQSKAKPNQGVFGGATMDFNLYQKKFNYYNSHTLAETASKYYQKRLGFGLCLGAKYNLSSRFYLQIRTSVLTKIFNFISIEDMTKIKPLNAQWTDKNNNFWWVSNLQIAYAF